MLSFSRGFSVETRSQDCFSPILHIKNDKVVIYFSLISHNLRMKSVGM